MSPELPRPRIPRPRTIFKWLAITLAAVLVVPPATAGVALATYLFMPLPASLPNEKPQADSRVSTVYAVDGTAIGEFREAESRVVIPPDQIPHNMKIAVIASEDKHFYQHSGVDWQGIARAFWADVRNRSLKQGGSTITQQLAKNLYTDGQRTISRKAKEALIAAQVERVMSKDEILAKYLNTVYMGDSVFGVEAAAQSYFKKDAKQLTLSEAALLAGVLPAPSLYSPRSNPENAERRRNEVLNLIDELRLAPSEEVAAARAETHKNSAGEVKPGPKVYPPPGVVGRYPYFLDYLRIYLLEVKKYSPDLVFRGGLKIETSLDPHLQEHGEKLLKKTFPAPKDPEAALVAVEPQTGFVRTVVGGTNWEESKVNLALGRLGGGSGRQAGSSFKPFVLARAFEAGVAPTKTYPGPSCITPRGFQAPVCNYGDSGFGSATLARAMAASINTVFVQLIVDVGIKQTAEVAKRLGITSIDPDKAYGGIAIGTQEVSPLDMSSAFGVFAARGLRAEPTPVLKITQRDGSTLEDNTQEDRTTRVLEEPVADNMNKVLTGVIEGGTGTAAKLGRPAAGKTGTSEEYQNAWFVGYTPTLSTAVWVGHKEGNIAMRGVRGVGTVTGGSWPARLWHDYMTEAMRGVPPTEFTQPAPIESLADKAKRDARGGFDLGGRTDAPGLPGGLNYYPSAPLPSAVPPTTTTTLPPESTTTTTAPPTTTTTNPPSTTTTFGFRRSSSSTTTTTSSSR
ncbi:MAG TPA: transglycosylase domain-containing protein, partial [Acidimicrobiia bacterium]|nr:transglycosylase domain-containing protein [Acidimicrobiia bacterium]